MALSSQQAGQTWVRSYLNSLGYKDDQIGFNPTNKSVTLNGSDFFQPTTIKNGQAFGTNEQLDSAMNSYNYRQGQKSENDLLTRYRDALDQPFQQQQFSYDPNSDPQYQAALRQAQSNAQQATGNAIASLNARGIDTSTVASDRAAQIQQQSLGQVTDQVLPQLMQQAYTQWANQQAMNYQQKQDQLNGIMNLLGFTSQQNQQYIENQMNQKNANLNAALAVGDATGRLVAPQSDWTGLFRQGTNQNAPFNMTGQQFQHGVAQDEFSNQLAQDNYNLNKRQTDASIANMNSDNKRQNDNTSYQRFMDVWQITNSAPDDYPEYGIKKGDPFPSSGGGGGGGSSVSYSQAVSAIDSSPYITKDDNGQMQVANPSGLEDYIFSLNLPEADTKSLYQRYGLKWGG